MLDDVGVYKGNELNRNLCCLLLPEKATFMINMFKKSLMKLDNSVILGTCKIYNTFLKENMFNLVKLIIFNSMGIQFLSIY